MKNEIIIHLKFISKNKNEIKFFLRQLSLYANKKIGKQKKGKPRLKMYKVIAGILYYIKTGCTWECLPTIFGNHKTIFGWYKILCDKKIFQYSWKELIHIAIENGILKILKILQDGSLVTCASRNGLAKHNPRNKNKLTINRFLGTNQDGIPLEFLLMSGTAHDNNAFQSTLHKIVNEFDVQPGFSAHADKGFDSKYNRDFVRILGGIPKIPRRAIGFLKDFENLNEKDSERYPVERTYAWTNSYKSLKNIFIKTPTRIKEMHCLFFSLILLKHFSRKNSLYLITRS